MAASPEQPSSSRPDEPASKEQTQPPLSSVNPLDFHGSVDSNDEPPTIETLRRVQDYAVLDREGQSHPFKSLYGAEQRVMVIFVRHFFCGNCQEYLRALSEEITPESLLALPTSTSIAVIGCGDPGLIDMYAEATGCRFPLYVDPTRRLYDELGMVRSLALGSRPAYARKSLLRSSLESMAQGLRSGMVTRGGNQRQIGGEFLFAGEGEKKVTWCHRMKTTRDHTEVPELKKVLAW